MATTVTPFLMFEGDAEEAMTFYVSLFDDARILEVVHFDEDGPGEPGTINQARFELCGREYICFDSPSEHEFGFTPSFSMFVEFDEFEEIEAVYLALSDGGQVLMPYEEYDFARRFCWLQDRFGLSWQLTLPHSEDDDEDDEEEDD